MTIQISVKKDLEAVNLLQNHDFINSYRTLAKADPKFTAVQELDFIDAWYTSYQDVYSPYVLLGWDAHGILIGIMALAQNLKSGDLVHAGENQAEYHGWIAKPEAQQIFLEECLIWLKKSQSLTRWPWNWLPPGSQIEWFQSPRLRQEGIYVTSESQEVPLWDLQQSQKLKKALKNRSFRSKMNRYKKRGSIRLERIKDVETFAPLLDSLAHQCDVRKEATYDKRPFEDDPHKAPFLLERIQKKTGNHLAALFLDDRPIAFHLGVTDGERVLLGLSTYDPSESKGSPGSLLTVLLAQMLTEEGYRYFDLTPGSDPYKMRYANGRELLHRPTLYFNRFHHLRGKALESGRQTLKGWLIRYKNPHLLRIRLADWKEQLRIAGKLRPKDVYHWLRNAVYSHKQYSLYKITHPVWPPSYPPERLCQQQFADLLAYRSDNPFQTRRRMLIKAMDRWSNGETVFTHVQDDQLNMVLWLRNGPGPLHLEEAGIALQLPENSLLLYDPFSNGEPEESLHWMRTCFLKQLETEREKELFFLIDQQQDFWEAQAREMGFHLQTVFHQRRFLFFSWGNQSQKDASQTVSFEKIQS